MDRRAWLLVEWVDETNVFPNYGIVNVDSLVRESSELHPGKIIFLRSKYSHDPRRAQILRISDDKRQVREYKLFLERQDHQVKSVISMCMRTIKEMRTDPSTEFGIPLPAVPGPSGPRSNTMPHVVVGTDSESSDSDAETAQLEDPTNIKTRQNIKSTSKNTTQSKQTELSGVNHNQSNQSVRQRRSLVSSTPVPNKVKENLKVTYDQGTQTDESTDSQTQAQLAKLDELEATLRTLYTRYLFLEGCVQNSYNEARESQQMDVSEAEQTIEYDRDQNANESMNRPPEEAGAGTDNSNVDMKVKGPTSNARTLQVRRVSAQTTNNAETSYATTSTSNTDMVAIGDGSVMVPARLLKEINWDSYTTATRQLLQAVFPRRILATHSLSGKQSPAFADKPPKKQLDPKIVEDIVNNVSLRCGVSKRLVRSCITTKCTDEAKLYRNRQYGRQSRQVNSTLEAPENGTPSPMSSQESSNGTD